MTMAVRTSQMVRKIGVNRSDQVSRAVMLLRFVSGLLWLCSRL